MDLAKELRLVDIADKYWNAQMNNDENSMKYWKDLMDKVNNDIIEIKEGNINGWRYYRNPIHGKMVAYYRFAGEHLIFETDEAFERWFNDEKKE